MTDKPETGHGESGVTMAKRATRTKPLSPGESWDVAVEAMTTGDLRTALFKDAWLKWVTYRRDEIGKPVNEYIVKRTIRKIEEWGHDRAIAALRHSMESGWTGVFEPGGQTAKPEPTRIKAAEGKYDNVRIHKK